MLFGATYLSNLDRRLKVSSSFNQLFSGLQANMIEGYRQSSRREIAWCLQPCFFRQWSHLAFPIDEKPQGALPWLKNGPRNQGFESAPEWPLSKLQLLPCSCCGQKGAQSDSFPWRSPLFAVTDLQHFRKRQFPLYLPFLRYNQRPLLKLTTFSEATGNVPLMGSYMQE